MFSLKSSLLFCAVLSAVAPGPAIAGSVVLAPVSVLEWKSVYGQVEARNSIPARARTGGTLVSLLVTEGDYVTAGQVMGTLRDDKIAFQVTALEAQLEALAAQLANAESELARGQTLVDKGVTTTQRLDQLSTQVDVVRSQIAAAEADRQVVLQQQSEGDIIAPSDGTVLNVPVTQGAVVLSGEAIATIAAGDIYLRLAIPERHALTLKQDSTLQIETGATTTTGRLEKIYPLIESGRVMADVAVDALPTAFFGARLLVRLPVGERQALMVPAAAVATRFGTDFVQVKAADGTSERAVVLGESDGDAVEVLTGLAAGDEVITP